MMIRYFYPEDVRNADALAVQKYGIPSIQLMENAGTNAAREVLKKFPDALNLLILAGTGNNGGDGFTAARAFLGKGLRVTVILSTDIESYKGDAKTSLDSLIKLKDANCTIKNSRNLSDRDLSVLFSDCDCIIDSLLGTGSKGAPRGEAERLIRLSENFGPIVAFDIPSGINLMNGEIYTPCIKAALTTTFLAAKRGMCLSPAYEMCGEVVVVDIGISQDKVLEDCKSIFSFEKDDISHYLPSIKRNIHKGKRGGVLIVGGSTNYRGAPLLAGLGALRSGAGLAILAIPDYMVDSAAILLPEAIFLPLRTIGDEIIPESAAETIIKWEGRCGACVIGPGLGRGASSEALIEWFWKKWKKPLLVDGDGLHFLPRKADKPDFRKDAVLTPHCGEAAAILGTTPEEVGRDRIAAAEAMTETAGTVLLKGMDSVVCSKEYIPTVIKGGSPVLAIPGSGDVLSGSVGALIASGMKLHDALTVGAAAHAAAGTLLEKKYGLRGALAREIADALPFTLS